VKLIYYRFRRFDPLTKSLVLALVASALGFAGDIRWHGRSALTDTYVASSTYQEPGIPGVNGTEYFLSVSVKPTDDTASAVFVRVMVKLQDGTSVVREFLMRAGAQPCTSKAALGSIAPAEIQNVLVIRLHGEQPENLTPMPN
jgi:hypothetical protein